jgi:hypothetical protein
LGESTSHPTPWFCERVVVVVAILLVVLGAAVLLLARRSLPAASERGPSPGLRRASPEQADESRRVYFTDLRQ